MVVTEFKKINSCLTFFSSPLISGRQIPSSLKMRISLASPCGKQVALIFLMVIGKPSAHIIL